MKLCECGCGQVVSRGSRFRHGHWSKANRAAISAVHNRGSQSNHGDGYITIYINGTRRLGHVVVAERALGHTLPPGAVVHHVDEDRGNNRASNLVICPNQAYHILLHQRMRAMEACGNPNWRLCSFCGRYDDPRNLYIPPNGGTIEHRACGRVYRAQRLEAKA